MEWCLYDAMKWLHANSIYILMVLALIAIFALAINSIFRKFYWKFKGVPCSPHFNDSNHSDENRFEQVKNLYTSLDGKNFGGYNGTLSTLFRPKIIVRDPKLIKFILSDKFDCFNERSITMKSEKEPLTKQLLNLNGDEWKKMKTIVKPLLLSNNVNLMFDALNSSSLALVKLLKTQENTNNFVDFDAKEYSSRFTMNVIVTSVFGDDMDFFNNPDSEFRRMFKRFLQPSYWKILRNFTYGIHPNLTSILGIKMLDEQASKYFINLVKTKIEHRGNSGAFVEMLFTSISEHFTELNSDKEIVDIVAAQCYNFLMAGYEPTSVLLTLTLLQISKNDVVQNSVREELRQKVFDQEPSFETIQKLSYLRRVIDETLRIHPNIPALMRRCTKSVPIPGSKFTIKKGTEVMIPVFGIQNDPNFFPDPENFNPDRFKNNKDIIPFTYLPFGKGERKCLGTMFGITIVKTAIAHILKHYELESSSRTEDPKFFKNRLTAGISNDIILRFKPINNNV